MFFLAMAESLGITHPFLHGEFFAFALPVPLGFGKLVMNHLALFCGFFPDNSAESSDRSDDRKNQP